MTALPHFKIVIPARYDSTRLPGKVLLPIAGKPMLQHVYERAQQSAAAEVLIATDSDRVETVASQFGAQVVRTRATHQSGTDRIAEVAHLRHWQDRDIVVNLQGDEPLMPAELIDQVAVNLARCEAASISTLCQLIEHEAEFLNPNVVKVVRDENNLALYFSRAAIPHVREASTKPFRAFRHLGIYAYRVQFLHAYCHWAPSELEIRESLEQLRALAKGHKIHVAEAATPMPPGVDTAEDLAQAEAILSRSQQS